MTLIAAGATKETVVVASDSLIGEWSDGVLCRTYKGEKIFKIGRCLIAFAGHTDWASAIIKEVQNEVQLPNDARKVALIVSQKAKSYWSFRFDSQSNLLLLKGESSIPPPVVLAQNQPKEQSVEFLICGWMDYLNGRMGAIYYLNSADNFMCDMRLQLKFAGTYLGYEGFSRCFLGDETSGEKLIKLINYCVHKMIWQDRARTIVDFPVSIWMINNNEDPKMCQHDAASLLKMAENFDSKINDAWSKI
jgi:hypothetical protein